MIRINTEVTGWSFIHIQYMVKEKVILKKKTLIWFFITYFEKRLLIICSIITPVYVPWTSIFRERVRWSIHYSVGEFLKHVYEVGVSDMCIFVKLRPTHCTKRSKELSIAFCTNIVNCHTCIQFKVSAH